MFCGLAFGVLFAAVLVLLLRTAWRRRADVAGWLSPNPGGVGPMTRAMLLQNVVEQAERDLA